MTLPRATALIALALCTTLLGPAVLVAAAPGLAEAVRDELRFELAGHAGSGPVAWSIFQNNLRVCMVPVLAALMAPLGWIARVIANGVTTVVVAANVALIGAAGGAYGTRLLPFLPHLPLEMLALGCGCVLLACSQRHGSSIGALGRVCLAIAVLLAAGAGIETYLTPQR